MAQIDLRNADVYVKDGYQVTGAVNQTMTPPATGDTSITVSGFTAAIPAGRTFTVVGAAKTYTVVSTTGGATPTAIVFTPAFLTGDGIPANAAVVTIGPNVLKVKIGEGNLTFEEKRSMEYVHDKRAISFVRTGDDEPLDVSLDAIWEFLSSDSGQPPTFEEAVKGIGGASTWVTAGADPCEPYAVILEVIYTPPCATVKSEKILLAEFRWESLAHDLKQGTIALKGKCKQLSPTISRANSPITP
jgi:hypothetical protein